MIWIPKNCLFFGIITLILFPKIIFGQPIITDVCNPIPGKYKFASRSGFVNEGVQGIEQMFDFQGLDNNSVYSYRYSCEQPSSRHSNYYDYPNANLVKVLDLNAGFNYLETSSSGIYDWGSIYNNRQIKSHIYKDPRLIFRFPLHFGDTATDEFSGVLIDHLEVTSYQTGHMSYQADAYGTLTFSKDLEFPDVLRVKVKEYFKDSIWYIDATDSIVYKNYIRESSYTSYYFLSNSVKQPLMIITHATSINPNGDTTINKWSEFYGGEMVSIKDYKSASFQAYPNPAQTILNLELPFINPGDLSINITDYIGKKVKTIKPEFYLNTAKINTLDLPSGIYNLHIYDGTNQIGTKRVNIQHD